MRWINRTASALAVATFGLIVLGALVRATHSGLSCPDWPTCYGFWAPTPSDIASVPNVGYEYYQIMLEWWHRSIAGLIVGPMTLALAALGLWLRRRAPDIALGSVIALALVVSQGALGAITVFEANSPISVAAHLGNALLFFAAVLYVRERSSDWAGASVGCPPSLKIAAFASVALALATMLAAAITSKLGATLECADWPLCDGQLLPLTDHAGLKAHLTHRFLAAATGVFVVFFAWLVARLAPPDAPLRRSARLAAIGVLAQIALGAGVILLEAPVWIAVAHQALGVFVFALLTITLWRSFESKHQQAWA